MHTLLQLFPEQYDPSSFRVIHTPGAAARRNLFYVQETGYLKTLRPLHTNRNNLESYLFVAVRTGEGLLDYDGRRWALRAGDCFLIDCRQNHAYESSAVHPWSLMWVHFNGLSSDYFTEEFRERHGGAPVAHQTPEPVLSALAQLTQLFRNEAEEAELLGSSLITQMLTALLLNRAPHTGALEEKLPQVRAYLEAHYAEELTLDRLSTEFFVSKYHLAHAFKNKYGDTVFSYIIRLRINRAKELLRFSDCSVAEIAAQCGFNDQSYFNRQFRRADGEAASAYRRKWKN